jgi:UPF0148 protein
MRSFEGQFLSGENDRIRSMAELLRAGATLTDLSCPACSSPLFRLKSGDLWCAQCQKKVVVVKEDKQAGEVHTMTELSTLESTLMAKVMQVNSRMQETTDLNELERLNNLMSVLLDNLEKARRLWNHIK